MSPTLMTRPRQIRPPSLTPWDEEEAFYDPAATAASMTPWESKEFYDQPPAAPAPVPAQPRAAEAAMPMEHGNEDEYPVPPQGLESPIEPPEDNPYFTDSFEAPMMPTAPNPFEGRMKEVMDKRTAHAGQRPNANDKQYNRPWWQRLAMAATNGAAGYVNAGGRARAATISPDVVASRPKYDAAMEDWRTQGEELTAEAQALQMEDSLRRNRIGDEDRARRIRSDADRATAYMENQRAQAARAARLPVPKTGPQLMNTAGGVLRTDTLTMVPGTGPAPKPVDAEDEMKRILINPLSTPAQRAEAQRYLAIMRKPGGGGDGAGPKTRAPQSSFIAIENRKNDALLRAERDYTKAITDDPARAQAARVELDQRKRQAQYDYEAEIEAAGGSVAQRPAAPPPPAPPPGIPGAPRPPLPPGLASPAAAPAAPARPRRPLSSY